jgi:hypothetical protein
MQITDPPFYSHNLSLVFHFFCTVQNCRQPLSFFHTKNNDKDDDDDLTNEEVCDMPPVLGPPGAYSVPTSCEYCGATHTSMCHDDCQRPTLFLRKMRPPFSPEPHRWDPVTGYELDEKEMEETQQEGPCDNVVDQGDENNTTTSEKDDSNKEEEKKEVDVESILQPSTPAEKNESSSWMNGFFLGLSPNGRTS